MEKNLPLTTNLNEWGNIKVIKGFYPYKFNFNETKVIINTFSYLFNFIVSIRGIEHKNLF